MPDPLLLEDDEELELEGPEVISPGDDALGKKYLKQFCVYWAPGPAGGSGEETYAAPVLIPCRWREDTILFKDSKGNEVASRALVAVDRDLEQEGILLLLPPRKEWPNPDDFLSVDFDKVNPRANKTADEIRGWKKIANRKAKKWWREAII